MPEEGERGSSAEYFRHLRKHRTLANEIRWIRNFQGLKDVCHFRVAYLTFVTSRVPASSA